MDASTTGLPRLPALFVQPKTGQTILYVLYSACLYLIPGFFAWEVSIQAWPFMLKCTLIAMATIFASHGLIMLGAMAHEGFHFSLHRNRMTSAITGIFFSSIVPLYSAVGFFFNHWHHHRHLNTASDPDCATLQQFKSPLARALFTRLHVNRKYLRTTIKFAFSEPAPTRSLGFSGKQFKALSAFNLFMHAVWLGAYVGLAVVFPQPMVFIAGLPIVATIAISGINPYKDHAGTSNQSWGHSRSRVSFLHTVLMGGTNYHLEHHLYPCVPCWRLPKLHRWLAENGHFSGKQIVVESGFLKSYRAVGLPYEFENNNSI